MTFSRLTKLTALGFAPDMHALLDRLEAQLKGDPLPDWMLRYDSVKDYYHSWQA
jgi:hypothetical protein